MGVKEPVKTGFFLFYAVLAGANQTNSMTAISAASPRRGFSQSFALKKPF